jgi:hypothetical protein
MLIKTCFLKVMHMLEKSINDSVVDQSDIVRRIKKLEGMQIDLVHSCDEVRTSTCELANTAAIWFPKYEAAACIISELSFKLEQTDEKIQAIYCDENLMQQMAQVAELKVQGLKDLMASSVLTQFGPELHNILEQVENDNLAHCQVVFNYIFCCKYLLQCLMILLISLLNQPFVSFNLCYNLLRFN